MAYANQPGARMPSNLPNLDDMRAFGSRPNSFGDAAAAKADPRVQVVEPSLRQTPTSGPVNAQSLLQRPSVPDSVASTPRPNPAAQAALTAKPIDTSTLLQKPSTDTIPARPTGATNATQNTRWFNPPNGASTSTGAPGAQPVGGAGDRAGGVSNAESVKRPGLRGAFDSAKSLGSSASGGVGKALNAISTPNAGGALAALEASYNEKAGLDAVERDPNATALDKGAAFGGSVGRVFGTGAGAIAGATKGAAFGSALGPAGTLIGGVGGGLAGAYYGGKAADAAIQVGQELTGSRGYGPAGAALTAAPAASAPKPIPADWRRQAFDDPRRVDRDPSRQSLGASRDFTNELASIPKDLPADLRQGVIHKTMDANGRPVYSGMNVGPNAQFVDGVGRGLRAGGEVNTVPGMSKEAINRTLTNPDGSKWSAQDNAMMAANLRDGVDPYRGMAQGGQRGGQILPNTSRDPREGQDEQKFRSEMAAIAARRDIPASTARALMRDVTDRRNNTADNSTRRDNNAADNATREKGDQLQAETSRYQADGPVRAKKAEIELAQAQRQRMADIVKAAGGDMALAQEIAVANGLDGSAFGAVADKQSDRASKSRERVKEYLAGPSSVRNKDGELEINPALQAQNADLLRNVAPGVEGMSGPQQAEVMRDAIPALNLINGANDLRNNSFWGMMPRFLGGTEAPPAMTSMPKFKSPLAEVGTWEGMTTFGGVGAGDYKATTVDGKTMYYPREKVGERELALLRQQGAPLGK